VEFSAHLDGWSQYLASLVGGVEGRFSFQYLSYKVRDYDLEDRGYWQYELSLTPDERSRLVQILLDDAPRPWRYGVFRQNCASYVVQAIAQAIGRPFQAETWLFITPDATVRWLRSKGRIVTARYQPSLQVQAQFANRALDPDEQIDVGRAILGYRIYQLEPQIAQQALANAISRAATYQIIRDASAEHRAVLFALKQTYDASDQSIPPPLDPSTSTGTATASIRADAGGKGELLSLRPGFIGPENQDHYGFRNATSEILRTDIRMDHRIRLEAFDVLNMESYSPAAFLQGGFTQRLSLGYHDWDTYLAQRHQEVALEFGRGWTVDLAGQLLSLMPFGSVKAIWNQHESGEEIRPAARVRLYGKLPLGVTYSATIDRYWNPRLGMEQLAAVKAAVPLGQSVGLTLTAISARQSDTGKTIGIGAYANF
jgi:hypothetical protein